MTEKSDLQLLREYVEEDNEGAFRELVLRHSDLVYSAALRQVASPELARDVAQSVFTDLARKARSLVRTDKGRHSVVGWLYRGTRFAALNQLREERRRHTRERQIMEELEYPAGNTNDWDRIGPMLDQVMAGLSDEDRQAVLLRFFQDRDFHSIGASLGISDDAAQKRVSRALEKLRAEFGRHGIVATTAALAASISANAVQVAPAELAASLSSGALAGVGIASAGTVTQTITMTTMQKSLIAATLAVVAGAGIYEAQQASRLRAEAQSLRQQSAPLTGRLRQLEHERDDLSNRLALLNGENAILRSNSAELPRLRGELARLRRDLQRSNEEDSQDIADTASSWVKRVAQLKQRLAQMPQAGIPELQFVTEQDWLNAARGELNSDADYRRALSALRGAGESVFASMLQKALKNYRRANPEQLPTDIMQLRPYFDAPVDEAALQRWEVAPAKTIQNLGLGGDIVITQREPVDDVFDARYGIGLHGRGTTDFLSHEVAQTMNPVWEAYRREHDGQWPDEVSQLQPYASTPEQQAALRKLVLKNTSGK